MCGIIGYIGHQKVGQVLFPALARLEYRGYDSAGIATIHDGSISLLKESGKLTGLKKLAEQTPLLGHLGIGHTRWATHGEPSRRNAHPHTDCTKKIAVVHNGIIENFEGLRRRLTGAGHVFESETDTEVLAHLIEEYHLKEGRDLKTSVQLTVNNIEGNYAFCVISAAEKDRFIATRNGSPLVVGVGRGENFIASDATAFLDYTREAIFLADHQMVVLSKNEVEVFSGNGDSLKSLPVSIDWDAKDASKEGFDHFMLKEIEEQPRVIETISKARLDTVVHEAGFSSLPMGADSPDVGMDYLSKGF